MKTEKETKKIIIDKILDLYTNLSLNNDYENFGKHKTKIFTNFIENIEKNKDKIYNLTNNNFHTNIKNEIDKILLKLKIEYKSNKFPSLLNFDNKLKELLKIDINFEDKKEQEKDIEKDIKKMLEKYFDKEYDLKKVDKFIKIISKSVSITNEKYLITHSLITKQIIKINFPYTMDKNNEIKILATNLEEHLNKKGEIPPPALDNNPTGPDLS
jgi:hypothetical protein